MTTRIIHACLVSALAIGGLAACDQAFEKHEIVRAGDQTFLLNTKTGETKLIDGTNLVPVTKTFVPVGAEHVARAKTWPAQTIVDLPGVTFTVRTKYRDGKMLWRVVAGPFDGALAEAYSHGIKALGPTVLFALYDEDGFKIGETGEVKIGTGARTVNAKNEIVELNWMGEQPMSLDTYQAAAYVGTQWYGFERN